MRVFATLIFAIATAVSCAHDEPVVGVGGKEAKFGDYSEAEVRAVRSAIAKLAFPAPDGEVEKMLPRPVEALPVRFVDWARDPQKKGRVGGMVAEYWLNRACVLEIATAYYSVGAKHYSMEEWAVVLTRKERDEFTRPIY